MQFAKSYLRSKTIFQLDSLLNDLLSSKSSAL